MTNRVRKGPGGCKPKLPLHLKRKVDTIGLLPHEWAQLDEIGPSRGKAVSKLLALKEETEVKLDPPVQTIKDAMWFVDQALDDDAFNKRQHRMAKKCLRELHDYLDKIGA